MLKTESVKGAVHVKKICCMEEHMSRLEMRTFYLFFSTNQLTTGLYITMYRSIIEIILSCYLDFRVM